MALLNEIDHNALQLVLNKSGIAKSGLLRRKCGDALMNGTNHAIFEQHQHLYNMQIFDGTALSWYTSQTLFSGWERSLRQFSTIEHKIE